MTLVALEGSGRPGSVAAKHEGEVVMRVLAEKAAHASDLLPTLDELVADRRSIRGILVGTGPGSFTGLRVAIATAMGIARGTGAPMRGVPSIEALLFDVLDEGQEGCVVLDARSRELYFAHYRRLADDVEAIVEPCVVPANEPLELPSAARLFSDDAGARAAAIDAARIDGPAETNAAAVLRLGERRLERLGPEAPESVEPLYLRPFAAAPRRR